MTWKINGGLDAFVKIKCSSVKAIEWKSDILLDNKL
jgi:hypothetical protein